MSLRRIKTRLVQQRDVPLRTEWYRGETSDLHVWRRKDGGIVHFQFAWGEDRQRLVEWREGGVLRAGRVDAGDRPAPQMKGTPIFFLEREVGALRQEALACFLAEARGIDAVVHAFVLARLAEGPGGGPGAGG